MDREEPVEPDEEPRAGEWDVTREWIERFSLETAEERADYLRMLARHLNRTAEPDHELCAEIGIGPLEGMLFDYEEELWPELERLAREDVRFRRAYASAWATSSPLFERREALLHELGESPAVSVSFVGMPEDFSDPPLLDWRAVEIEGDIDDRQLARILREIATWADERDAGAEGLATRQRHLRDPWWAWSRARAAVERAAHALAVEDDPKQLAELARRIDEARQIEAARWHALRAHL